LCMCWHAPWWQSWRKLLSSGMTQTSPHIWGLHPPLLGDLCPLSSLLFPSHLFLITCREPLQPRLLIEAPWSLSISKRPLWRVPGDRNFPRQEVSSLLHNVLWHSLWPVGQGATLSVQVHYQVTPNYYL
jgi:hypothetical protein